MLELYSKKIGSADCPTCKGALLHMMSTMLRVGEVLIQKCFAALLIYACKRINWKYMKNFLKLVATVVTIALTACGGGGSTAPTPTPTPAPVPVPIVAPFNTAMYQAPDGVGQSKFIELTLPKQSYIDVTNFLTSVQLYSPSLQPLIDNLSGSNLIQAGSYKLKVTYSPTSNIPGNVTFYSTALTPYKTLNELRSVRYDAVGFLGAYSEYYKLTVAKDTNIDITTSKAHVFVFNASLLGENVSLLDNFVEVSGTKFLAAGEYIVKISFVATSLTPGSVTVYIP